MYSALTDFTFKFVFFDLSLTIHTMGFLLLFLIAKQLCADFVAVAECISCDAALLLNKFVTGA